MRSGTTLRLIALAALVACGYPSIDGDPIPSTAEPTPPEAAEPEDSGPPSGADAGRTFARSAPVEAGPPPSTTCKEPDLVLCFPFEGDALDHSAAPIAASETTDVTFGPGKEDRAGVFAADSALRFAPNAALELPGASATVEAWIDRTQPGDAVVFDDDGRLSLTIDDNGKLLCKSSGGAVTGATDIPVAQWVHVACVIDGGTLTAYRAGAPDASGPGSVGSSPTSTAAIGGNAPSGEPFIGSIDSLRVFKVARTPAQIAAAAR